VILRATMHDDLYGRMLSTYKIDDIVDLAPPAAYRDTLLEMVESDGLLLFQGASCNHQIPAKIYEYFRARRPIFALTDPAGDTAAALREASVGQIVPMDDPAAIASGLAVFLEQTIAGTAPVADAAVVAASSRAVGARTLAGILDQVAHQGCTIRR
jgi:hypothetical protein